MADPGAVPDSSEEPHGVVGWSRTDRRGGVGMIQGLEPGTERTVPFPAVRVRAGGYEPAGTSRNAAALSW